jgi:hypothetical protein
MCVARAFLVLAVATALGALGAPSAAWAKDTRWWERGGFVKPCSLDGVNPAYHPYIFGNPAFARAVFGFVQARDGTWRVEPNCRLYN